MLHRSQHGSAGLPESKSWLAIGAGAIGVGDDLARDLSRIVVESPPPPQRTVPETHYVPFETDSFAKAHQWASEQVARKYPGATEVLQAQESLIKQHLALMRAESPCTIHTTFG